MKERKPPPRLIKNLGDPEGKLKFREINEKLTFAISKYEEITVPYLKHGQNLIDCFLPRCLHVEKFS